MQFFACDTQASLAKWSNAPRSGRGPPGSWVQIPQLAIFFLKDSPQAGDFSSVWLFLEGSYSTESFIQLILPFQWFVLFALDFCAWVLHTSLDILVIIGQFFLLRLYKISGLVCRPHRAVFAKTIGNFLLGSAFSVFRSLKNGRASRMDALYYRGVTPTKPCNL